MYNLAYFGSPDFSANLLERLLADKGVNKLIEVKFIITQTDRLSGRKQIQTATPVKSIASKHQRKIIEIEKFKVRNSIKFEELKLAISSVDIALVYAYAGLIPEELLNTPKYGFWCIHPSLLPKYRGTSPIATALINGDKKVGVSIIEMDEKIDHGPIIAQNSLTIENADKRPDLEKKLTTLAFKMFKELVSSNLDQLHTTRQEESLVTFTKKLTKQDGFISFEELKKSINNQQLPAAEKILFNLFRGLYPWPGIWTIIPDGKRLKITEMEMINNRLIIKKVQLEGKKEVDFEIFNKAYKVF